MRFVHDEKYRFTAFFNPQNGMYVRAGILDDNGKDTGIDPVRASLHWPQYSSHSSVNVTPCRCVSRCTWA